MVTSEKTTPRMADAETAARAVAVDTVSRVLLFGSVARGDAGPHSDIDLVAIHDDLDYSTRRERSTELGQMGSSASGHRVFVYVTDWPEWDHRSTKVSTSIEHAITGGAVTLYDRAPARVHWGKRIGLPATNREEAAGRLDNARRGLFGLTNNLALSQVEKDALADRDPLGYEFGMKSRMVAICGEAHMATEASLKALIHLGGTRPGPNP